MPILFGSLWKNADQFSFELQSKGFDPLQGELRLWWIVFRNVQNDLQINASNINKAKYLTIQEWVILSTTYQNAKIYFEKTVNDLVKQTAKNTASAYVAAQEEKTLNVKEFLTDKNTNDREIDQNLIHFISHLDIHFHNLARISPMGKLLREYRDRIALAIPFYGATTDVQPPTIGIPPIYTNPNGGIELLYDPETLFLNAEGQLTTVNSAPHLYDFVAPLNLNHYTASLLYNPNDFNLNSDNQLSIINQHKSLIDSVSNPLTITDRNLTLNYNPADFNLNTSNQLSIINQHKSVIETVSDPFKITNKNLSLNLTAPLSTTLEGQLGLQIGSHLGLNADGSLDGLPYFAVEPLRLTNNVEFSLGYDAPLYQSANQNLGIRIDNNSITLNAQNQLQANVYANPVHPLYLNEASDLTLAFGSPLFMNPSNELTLNYTPVFKLNNQQQLDLKLAKPLILDSNHDLTLDYTGGLTMLNSKLQLNLVVGGPLNINNRQELALDIATNGALAQGDSLYVKTDTTTIGINSNNQLTLSSSFQDKITQIQTEVSNLIHETRELTQINNRLTRLEEETINYTIYKQGTYKFRNKIQSGNSRFDNILENIPTHLKIVNIKGRFIIQHNYGSYLFASFHLDQLQDFSFSTHPNNQYYANYITYFKQTISNPVILRLYRDRDTLKYNVNSGNITSQQGYNIFLEYQILIKDTEEQVRNTWNLIKGQAYLLPTPWLYYFPKFLILKSTTTISFSWTYQNTRYTSGNVSTSYGIPISLYLNNRSGKKWSIKIKDANSFVITCASMVMIQDLAINVTN